MTQATLSRDIRDLGLVKRSSDGAYQQQGAEPPVAAERRRRAAARDGRIRQRRRIACSSSSSSAPGAGMAQPLALAIDRAKLDDVVGHARRRRHDPRHFADARHAKALASSSKRGRSLP